MASQRALRLVLLSCILFALFFSTIAQTCTHYVFSRDKLFDSCSDLPGLNSSLHWSINLKTGVVDLAYRQPMLSTSRWISWGINPTSSGMVGSQSLVAFQGSDGVVRAYTSPIMNYKTKLERGNISFPVHNISGLFEDNEMFIFATIILQNRRTVNHLWQEGPMSGDTPGVHLLSGSNMKSMATLDLLSGATATTGGAVNSKQTKKNVHGWLCAVGWGVMMPLGVISARYLKVFELVPHWFYVHVFVQMTAYAIGVTGYGIGLDLGAESSGIQYKTHRNVGISIFFFATLQAVVALWRPNPEHKYRLYWKIYHQVTGCAIIILSTINVFGGLDILDAEKKWTSAYIIVLAIIGAFGVVLEVLKWQKSGGDET